MWSARFGAGCLTLVIHQKYSSRCKDMVFQLSGTVYVYFLLVLLASVMLAGAAACSDPAPTATALPVSPPPTETPNPWAVSSSQAQAGAPAYWSGPATWEPEEIDSLQRVTQRLVDPPFLPEHEQEYTGAPRVVEVRMEIEEKEIEVAPGVFTWAFTFNGSVPGPMIVVHEGDYVELTLVNPSSNQLLHNVDFHASVGALGGGALTHVNPGQEVVLRFRAIKPGVFVYHCAPSGTMVPWHVVHGMNGAIMVLPRDGLRDPVGTPISYDRAYYIGEQDYYLPKDENGEFKRFDTPSESFGDDLAAMETLTPTHIVFNGSTGALQGDGQLTARVGENVLIVHAQANRQSYPHLIGGHGDYVWERGGFNNPPALDLETWVIAAGSAGASIHTIRQPGTHVYLSHNLIEAFLYDAKAILVAEGEWDNDLMEQVGEPGDIQ